MSKRKSRKRCEFVIVNETVVNTEKDGEYHIIENGEDAAALEMPQKTKDQLIGVSGWLRGEPFRLAGSQ